MFWSFPLYFGWAYIKTIRIRLRPELLSRDGLLFIIMFLRESAVMRCTSSGRDSVMGQLPAHHINKQTNKHQHVVIHGYAIIIILVNYESVTLDYCSYCAVDWSGRNQTSLWSWLCSRSVRTSCSNKLEHWRMIWSTSLGCCEAVAYLGKSVGLHHILNLFLFIRQAFVVGRLHSRRNQTTGQLQLLCYIRTGYGMSLAHDSK